MKAEYITRCSALQKNLSETEAILLSNAKDIRYLTGFISLLPDEREAFLLLTQKEALLLYASFCPITKQTGFSYHPSCSFQALEEKITAITERGIQKLAIDKTSLFVSELEVIRKVSTLVIQPFDREKIWNLRRIKDVVEQTAIRTASSLTKQAYEAAVQFLKVGVSEYEVATEIEFFMKRHGAELAFPIIVAFGPHSALPHHQPTDTVLTEETAVLIDLGAKVDGYCGDMTRTIWFGKNPSPEFVAIEAIILEAYSAAKKIYSEKKETTVAKDIDLAARDVIQKAGHALEFIHTTGHGLGLDIHESPSLYKTQTTPILPNMSLTIEPGIYLLGKFGFRYENTLIVTKDDCVELTKN